MKRLLTPNLCADSVFDIDLLQLKEKGIEALIVDIDNTLVSWETKQATREVILWLEKVKEMGFKVCIVSNATEERVVKFTEEIKIFAVHRAVKPRKKPFIRALNYLKSESSQTAMIGDQIFTDVLGGNRTGLYTILVVPISDKEFIWTRLVRKLERLIVKRMVTDGDE